MKIPRDSIVVVTGVSGSGKSSLAFDTVFQEGQRRFVESLSAYARQFIGRMKHPEVESVRGISPTISIDQKTVNRNPRSTVGTVVEILDHYRLLFARLGVPHCPKCGKVIQAQTVDQIVDNLYVSDEGKQITVMAPIVQERKGEYRKELAELKENGFVRARVDGTIYRLEEVPLLVRYEKHTIEVVIDRLTLERKNMSRLREAIEGALKLTDGKLVSFLLSAGGSAGAGDAADGMRRRRKNTACRVRCSLAPSAASLFRNWNRDSSALTTRRAAAPPVRAWAKATSSIWT